MCDSPRQAVDLHRVSAAGRGRMGCLPVVESHTVSANDAGAFLCLAAGAGYVPAPRGSGPRPAIPLFTACGGPSAWGQAVGSGSPGP